MLKQRTLFMFPMVCLLGLFFLSMSGAQVYSMDDESQENSDTYDALQQQQDSSIDYKSRGKSYLDKGQFDDAISDLNKAI